MAIGWQERQGTNDQVYFNRGSGRADRVCMGDEMSMSREQRCYMDTYSRIVSIADKEGAEAAIAEARRRCISGTPPHVDKSAEHDFVHKAKLTMLQTVLILSMVVLHDEFDFGHDRLMRFKKRFEIKSECLADDEEVNWKMMRDILMEEANITTDLVWHFDGEDPTERKKK